MNANSLLYSKPAAKERCRHVDMEDEQSDEELKIANTQSKGKVSDCTSDLNHGSALMTKKGRRVETEEESGEELQVPNTQSKGKVCVCLFMGVC